MKTSDYPRDFKHERDGAVWKGRFREFRKPTVPVYGASNGEMEEKLLVEFDLVDSGEPVTYWLREGKLLSLFQAEIRRRVKAGKDKLEPGEVVTITRSNEKRPSKTSGSPMWDYDVEFEHGAPPATAAELVLGTSDKDAGDVEIPTSDVEIPVDDVEQEGAGDGIPF